MNHSGRIKALQQAARSFLTHESQSPPTQDVLTTVHLPIIWLFSAFAVAASILISITLTPYPPLQDFLEWVYQGKLIALMLSGSDLVPIRIADYPVPNSTTQIILGLLSLTMPSSDAAVVFLLCFVVITSLVAWALAKRYQRSVAGPLCLVLIVSVFFSGPFWNGYSNYAFALLLFGVFLLISEPQRTNFGVTLAFSIMLFFTHLTIFVAFLVFISLQALASRRILPVMLGVMPSVALACWYYVALDRNRLDPGEPAVGQQTGQFFFDLAKFAAYKTYTATKIGPYHNFVFASGGDAVVRPTIYWGGVLLNCLYALACFVLLFWGMRRAIVSRSVKTAPITSAIVIGVFFLVFPPGRLIANTGERFMYPALLLLLLFLPLHRGVTRVMGAAAVLMLISLVAFALEVQDWRTPLWEASWDKPQLVLYQHRPTAFALSWFELESAAAGNRMPEPRLNFETSILISSGAIQSHIKP